MPEIVLTNIGHKALLALVADGGTDSPEFQRLSKVATEGVLLLPSDTLTEQLLLMGRAPISWTTRRG